MRERLAAGEPDDQHAEKDEEARRPVRPEQAKGELAALRIGAKDLVAEMECRRQERS
jgi:citrate lyase beta subunit